MLRLLTSGESHGKALVVILEGMPSGLEIKEESINDQLARRQKGYGRGNRMKIEKDRIEILSGIRGGLTLGSPISLKIDNKDWPNWQTIMDAQVPDPKKLKSVHHPRPGHADLPGGVKYDQRDLRNILERASARETTSRVAGCAITRQFLESFGIRIVGHVTNLGGVLIDRSRLASLSTDELIAVTEASELRCIDPDAEIKMKEKVDFAKKTGDTLGGIFEIVVEGLPVGLGSHVQWDRRLDGKLSQAIMSIQAIKGVEIGDGFESASLFGSQVHDEIFYNQEKQAYFRKQNRAGGLEGGITNGSPLVIRAAMKPLSTLMKPLQSVNIDTHEPYLAAVERTDTTAVPAAAVIAENVVAYTLADVFLEKFGCDSMTEIRRNFQGYLDHLKQY